MSDLTDTINEALQDAIGDGDGRPRADALERHLAKRGLTIVQTTTADLLEALRTIAEGNVPHGFLNNIESESKASFQERFATWMQRTAREALKPAPPA